MKKTILMAWFALIAATCSQAQYFQKLYNDNSSAYNGLICTSTGAGHLIAGVNQVPDYGLMVVRTDLDGGFSSFADFNLTYVLTTTTGQTVSFTSGHVLEYSNGTGYAVMGSMYYNDPTAPSGITHALAFIRLDLSGNVMALMQYNMPVQTYSLDLKATCESSTTPTNIYATAHFVGNSEASYVVAMSVDVNGTLLWGRLYDFPTSRPSFATPYDIIESPYNNSELLIVGDIFYMWATYPSPIGNGFCLTLNRGSGSVLNMQEYQDANDNLKTLAAISVSNDPLSPGFILTGYTYDYHEGKLWVLKTDANMNPLWSNLYSENHGGIEDIVGYDVVGRLNTLGDYEYYVTGRKEQILFDAIIMKIDNNGIPANPGGLFVYSTNPLISQWGNSIAVNTSGTADGVSMYGIWEDPWGAPVTRRSYIVKAYFNGQSGCNENFTDVYEAAFPVTQRPTPVNIKSMSQSPITLKYFTTENDITLCYNKTLPGGDNTFTTSVSEINKGKDGLLLFPNPLDAKDKSLSVRMQAGDSKVASLCIVDMLGRKVFTGTYQLDKGENILQVNISDLSLNKGMYQVVIEKDSGREVVKLVIN
jgi:hypothetical protein